MSICTAVRGILYEQCCGRIQSRMNNLALLAITILACHCPA
ncbi:hypothetical protein ACVLVH_004522 [Kluyvera sp. 1366]